MLSLVCGDPQASYLFFLTLSFLLCNNVHEKKAHWVWQLGEFNKYYKWRHVVKFFTNVSFFLFFILLCHFQCTLCALPCIYLIIKWERVNYHYPWSTIPILAPQTTVPSFSHLSLNKFMYPFWPYISKSPKWLGRYLCYILLSALPVVEKLPNPPKIPLIICA